MAVQMRTMLAVADNSGARKLQVILPLGGGLGKKAGLGDIVTAAVKEASPDGTIKKGKGSRRLSSAPARNTAGGTAPISVLTKTPRW